MDSLTKKYKARLIVKEKKRHIVLPVIDIAMIFMEQRLVFLKDKDSMTYLFHKTLAEIQDDLDKRMFFRANRRTIVNIQFVKAFSELGNNKIKLDLAINHEKNPIVVSQQTAPHFKAWLCEY